MKTTKAPTKARTLPMPLWLQGVIELLITAAVSIVAVLVLLTAVWFAGGFDDRDLLGVARLSSQIWLLIHGVPLHLEIPEHGTFAAISGTISLIPLGLTLIPLALCFRAGRRLAQASYEGQFWVPTVAGTITYSLVSLALSLFSTTAAVSTHPIAAALTPVWVVLLGLIGGGWYESRSLARMIGVNAAEWVSHFSQYSRWAGSYVWAVLRSSLVAVLALVAGGALLFVATIFYNWNDILAVYQMLGAGGVGDTAVTLLELGIVPNFVVWAMAWSTGAGFSIGEGTVANLAQTNVGAMPALPVLGALPNPIEPWSYLALIVPIAAGICAGWWFFRAGENHFDEWLSLKIRFRWISSVLSTLALALFIAIPAGIITALIGWFAHGSLGLGRFTIVGPAPLLFGALAAAWIAVGVILGSILAPLVEPDTSKELDRFAQDSAADRRARRRENRRAKKAAAQQNKSQRKNKTKRKNKDEREKSLKSADAGVTSAHGSVAADSVSTEAAEASSADHMHAIDRIFSESDSLNSNSSKSISAGSISAESEKLELATSQVSTKAQSTTEAHAPADTKLPAEPEDPTLPRLTRGPVIRRPQARKNKRPRGGSSDEN
ncbi:MAG: DUF6350 family protein [Rothia sp. (in: high G+C Gram-positive bacteria)]|nr:DUF6350 family protein [Rothia sp. (in: high G+C Gram-positive bacteria)]